MRLNREVLLLCAEPFEFVDSLQQTVNFDRAGDVTVLCEESTRYPDNDTAFRHVAHHDCVGSNATVVADDDGPENLRSGADQYTITNRGVTLTIRRQSTPEGGAVVHRHVVTDDGGLSNHDTNGVVNEESFTNEGGRMYVHARQDTRDGRQAAREEVVIALPQRVREVIAPDRVESGIGENDFGTTVGCGVALHHYVNVPAKRMRHGQSPSPSKRSVEI